MKPQVKSSFFKSVHGYLKNSTKNYSKNPNGYIICYFQRHGKIVVVNKRRAKSEERVANGKVTLAIELPTARPPGERIGMWDLSEQLMIEKKNIMLD
jgi:hypothetical protein